MFWQQENWNYLLSRKKNSTLPHAILLTGAAGLGKLEFAKRFAGLLFCQQNTADQPCGQCCQCQLYAAGSHPDFKLVQPDAPGKAIKIEQIRELISGANFTAQQGGYRVVIIEPVDMMNIAASNALLKTLEEPPDNCLFILVTNKPHLLSATILSRCQKIGFLAPQYTDAKVWLQGKIKDDAVLCQYIDSILAQSENAPLAALELLASENYQVGKQLQLDFINVGLQQTDALEFAAKYLRQDLDLVFILANLTRLVADLIKIKFGLAEGNSHFVAQDFAPDVLAKVVAKTSLVKFFALYDQLLEVIHLHENNINLNRNLVLEKLALSWR